MNDMSVTAEQPDVEALAKMRDIAAVLAEHQRRTSPGGPCWCGEWPRDDERRDTWMDHVAAALAPVLAAAVREARAAELREAADEMEAIFRAGRLLGGPTDDWLRDRADRIAVDAPEVCACSTPGHTHSPGLHAPAADQ